MGFAAAILSWGFPAIYRTDEFHSEIKGEREREEQTSPDILVFYLYLSSRKEEIPSLTLNRVKSA